MKRLTLLVLISLISTTTLAADCQKLAIKAATLISKGVNQGQKLTLLQTREIQNDSAMYVLEVSFDYPRPDGGALMQYTVSLEKMPGTLPNQCGTVRKVELTGEE